MLISLAAVAVLAVAGWLVGSGGKPPLAIVATRDPCLDVMLRGTAGVVGHQSLRLTPVGYSRSEQGGLFAATFQVRCHGAQRQVRIGAPGAHPDLPARR